MSGTVLWEFTRRMLDILTIDFQLYDRVFPFIFKAIFNLIFTPNFSDFSIEHVDSLVLW